MATSVTSADTGSEGKNKKPIAEFDVLEKDVDQPIAPDQFDEKYRTTKLEIWAYYACVA